MSSPYRSTMNSIFLGEETQSESGSQDPSLSLFPSQYRMPAVRAAGK